MGGAPAGDGPESVGPLVGVDDVQFRRLSDDPLALAGDHFAENSGAFLNLLGAEKTDFLIGCDGDVNRVF